jgi:hypothetical protein
MTRKTVAIGTALSILFSWATWTFAQEGILRGPTPPLVINPERPQSKTPASPSAPALPSAKPPAGSIPEKGVVNPRTGEFYPGTIGGVVNPQTGEVLPKVEGGYINPKTGEFLPAQK